MTGNKRPTVRVNSQTANCIEIYINDVRIIACGIDEDKDEIRIEANGKAEIEVQQ